jgi:hypothetical protein
VSAERGSRPNLISVVERLAILEQTTKTAHSRVDDLKATTAADLTTIRGGIQEISKEIKQLLEWKNKAAGALLLASLLGGVASTVVARLIAPAAQAQVERTVGPQRK